MKKFVVGHKNPDTDSAVSAIALALFLGDSEPALAGDLNKETSLVLDRFGFEVPAIIPPEEKEVALVDHNEPSQIHENIKNEEIVAIFDHHKLGGLATPGPISIRVEPIGATSSIVAKMYEEKGQVPEKNLAGLLLAGIISDTFNLNSPTQTQEDVRLHHWLQEVSGVEPNSLAQEMFAAKSDISDVSTEDLITKDFKVFDMNGNKVGIGVWETVALETIMARKEEITELLKKAKEEQGLDLNFFAAVDIVNNLSQLFIVGDEEASVAEKAFSGKTADGILELPGIVSRKKEIAPAIEKSLI